MKKTKTQSNGHHLETKAARQQYSDGKYNDFSSTALQTYGEQSPQASVSEEYQFVYEPTRTAPGPNKVMTMKERAEYSERTRGTDPIAKLMTYQDKASAIPRKEIDLEYLPELAPIESCLGKDLCRSVLHGDFRQSEPLHNLEFTLYVALRSLEFLYESDKRWTSWSGMPPSDFNSVDDAETENRYWRLTWMRTAFRCIACMPIGYIISQVAFRGSVRGAPSWSPANEDMIDYAEKWGDPKVTKTDFYIDPRETSLLTYARLFGGRRGDVPMLAHAEADFFSDKPNRHNPIWRAYHRALNHVLAGRRYLPLPYWWSYAINHEYIADSDFVPLRAQLQCRDGFSFGEMRQTIGDPSQDKAESGEQVVEPEQPVAQSSVTTPLSPILENACTVARDRFAANEFTANAGGCVFQGIAGRVSLVVPWFWDKLANHIGNPSLTAERLHQAFADAGLLENGLNAREQHFAIVKPGTGRRLGKCRTLPLSPMGQQLLFPEGVPFGDNPDLEPMAAKNRASAA